jgi:hypothetical protein
MRLEAGLGQKGSVVFYHGTLPLPKNATIIRTDARGDEKKWSLTAATTERAVSENYQSMPEVFQYLLPLSPSAPREIAASVKAASNTEQIQFYDVTSIALSSGLAIYDEGGREDYSYRLEADKQVLVNATPTTSSTLWMQQTAKSIGQNVAQSQVRLGWFIPAQVREQLQGVVVYRAKPFDTKMELLHTLRGFQKQGDSLIATVRDTTTHVMGSWHYGIRMINKFGATSALSDLLMAHNYPPGSRPWFESFRAIGSSESPTIRLKWKIGNAFRAQAVNIFRSRNPDGPFTLIHTAAPSDTLYTDNIQDVMEAYHYYLHVVDVAGDSSIISVIYPAVSEFKPVALPVSELTCDTLGRNIRVRWNGNGPGDRGYYVMRTEGYDEKKLASISGFIPALATTNSYEYIDKDTVLRGDRFYTYGIITESHGYRKSEIIATASARPNRSLYVPCPSYTNIRKEDNGNGAMLTWEHVTNDQYDRHFGYRIYARKKSSTEAYTELQNKMILLDTNWQYLTNADNTLEYSVRAIDMYGNKSAFSKPARLEDVFESDFGPRYLRTERISETQIELRWNTPLNDRISGYQLYMTNGETEPVVVGKFTSEVNSHKVSPPAAPLVHYYFIVAIDASGVLSTASEWVLVQ